jgi:integrase/recombinase XerD
VLGVVRDLRSPKSLADPAQAADYQEHLLAEFVLARLAHGVADGTIRGELAAVEEFLASAGVWAWEVEARHADRFLGHDQRGRAQATRRGKAGAIDFFYRFLELRYRGELHELTGRLVASPIDQVNRPRHSGDFTVRVPPAPAALNAFFAGWRGELAGTRRWLTATRHYAMARLAAEVGLRLRELCALGLDDVHFDHGPLGKLHVRAGKGARGSGHASGWCPCWGMLGRCWCGGSPRSAASSATTGGCQGRRCSPASGAARSAVIASRPRWERWPAGTWVAR